ncbi:MAG: hypothetical protein HQK77_03400 [Desulfobacterales bacterium]|nr:hypothetical protein [Desulfobacterales bacterium]
MHYIKKYANRKLYDTTDKRYLTMDQLAEVIKSGKEVSIIDNKTGKDLTSSIVSQLLARDDTTNTMEIPTSHLIQLLRKGSDTLVGYGKKYVDLWQSAFIMSRDETEKFINILIKNKELSETEGTNLLQDIQAYVTSLKNWITEKVDNRVNEVLSMMNLVSKDQLLQIQSKMDTLYQRIDELEKKLDTVSVDQSKDNS